MSTAVSHSTISSDYANSPSSSKSPSPPTTSSLATTEDLNDASHFEDISLADDIRTLPQPIEAVSSGKTRPLLRPAYSLPSPPRIDHAISKKPFPPRRESSQTSILQRNSSQTNLSQQIHLHSQRRNLPSSKSSSRLDRGWKVPAPDYTSRQHNRRSPSPSTNFSPRPSPRASRANSSSTLQPDSVFELPVRRPQLGGPRKSVVELERECDETSDDDLPDDAVISNIPLSPRPPHETSISTSPERPQTSQSIGPNSRTKSWNVALHELSEDMQALTVKLETHHDECRQRSHTLGGAPSPIRRKSSTPTTSRITSLPPVQKGSPLIDPLPASKEKEKHLTRTRPSWLPPKDPREEKRHLKEYQKMMSKFTESERRKSAEAVEQSAESAKEHYNALEAWQNRVLVDWQAAMSNPRTRDMWWRGVPAAIRGTVWSRAVRNDLHLSNASFVAALGRAKATEQRLTSRASRLGVAIGNLQDVEDDEELEEDRADDRFRRSLAAVDADILTTFPPARLFQHGQRLHVGLRDLLMAYASYRSDTGHVRGTARLAAVILAHTSQPAEAFVVFANLLNRPHSLAFCINDHNGKERVYRQIMRAVKYKLPRLHEHLVQLSFDQQPDEFLELLCTSIATSHLDLDQASRACDIVVFEGDSAIVRTVVGVLGRLEAKLYGSSTDLMAAVGWPGYTTAAMPFGSAEEAIHWIKWAGKQEP